VLIEITVPRDSCAESGFYNGVADSILRGLEFNSSAISGEKLRREAALDGTFRLAADAHITEVGYGSNTSFRASAGHFRAAPISGHLEAVGT
jgi:hypothetical protein